MQAIQATSTNIPTLANMSAQVAARPERIAGDTQIQNAGETKQAHTPKLKTEDDLVTRLREIQAQIAARAEQAADVNALDISYSKREALLSVKVKEQLTGDLVRELQFKDYQAKAYSNHGYKGGNVDLTA